MGPRRVVFTFKNYFIKGSMVWIFITKSWSMGPVILDKNYSSETYVCNYFQLKILSMRSIWIDKNPSSWAPCD